MLQMRCKFNMTLKKSLDRSLSPCFYGAGERSRTSDLPITNRLLYQLSYAGVGAIVPVTGHGDKNPSCLVIRRPLLPLRVALPDGG